MRRRVTVTQLVDFAKCEKLAVLKLQHKEEVGAARRKAIDAGIASHSRLERQSMVDGRCFVASYAFGPEAPETAFLRRHRDRVWVNSVVLCKALRLYYWLSPKAIAALRPVPGAKKFARGVIRGYVFLIGGGPHA